MAGPTLRAFARVGMTRGILRGSRFWLYVGVGAWILRLFGRMANRRPIVVTEALRPGERLLVSHLKRR